MRNALDAAGVATHPSDVPVAARLLYAPRSIFGVFVNDTTKDVARAVTINGAHVDVMVPAGGSRLVLWDRATGKLIVETK
jgi:hypothetical protein